MGSFLELKGFSASLCLASHWAVAAAEGAGGLRAAGTRSKIGSRAQDWGQWLLKP